MVFCGERHERLATFILHGRHVSFCHDQSRRRFSVALPLGINGNASPRGIKGRVYPKNKGCLYPTFELNPAVRRTARAGRLPTGGPQCSQAHCGHSRAPAPFCNALFFQVRAARSPAARRAAKALPICFRPQPAENEDGAGAEYFGPPHPGAAGRPLPRGLSYSLSAPNTVPSPAQNKAQSTAQISSPMPGPARRENRNRFSRLKNRHGPKHGPVLRSVSASLRLRFRSAAFSARLRDSAISA